MIMVPIGTVRSIDQPLKSHMPKIWLSLKVLMAPILSHLNVQILQHVIRELGFSNRVSLVSPGTGRD